MSAPFSNVLGTATSLRDAIARAEAAGRSRVMLTTWRRCEPRRTLTLARGLKAAVVSTERADGGFRVVFDLRVADVRRWIDRQLTEEPR